MVIYGTSVPFSRNYKTFSSMCIITGIHNINDIQNWHVFTSLTKTIQSVLARFSWNLHQRQNLAPFSSDMRRRFKLWAAVLQVIKEKINMSVGLVYSHCPLWNGLLVERTHTRMKKRNRGHSSSTTRRTCIEHKQLLSCFLFYFIETAQLTSPCVKRGAMRRGLNHQLRKQTQALVFSAADM